MRVSPNGILVGSSVCAMHTVVTYTHTDMQTTECQDIRKNSPHQALHLLHVAMLVKNLQDPMSA